MYNESKYTELKITCSCKSKLKIQVVKLVGLNALEKFVCPNCKKEHFITAAVSIKNADVVVLIGRN